LGDIIPQFIKLCCLLVTGAKPRAFPLYLSYSLPLFRFCGVDEV
jgi:hypothetical protein